MLELRAAPVLRPTGVLPTRLTAVERQDERDATATRRFELSGRRSNGRKMDMGRVDATVTRDSVEVWEVHNRDGTPHNFHVHGLQFQVLSVDGRVPPAPLRGWKDTVFLPPGATLRLIMRFPQYSDVRSPYMFHCHLLMHEDRGMMGQFVVVDSGRGAGPADSHPHGIPAV